MQQKAHGGNIYDIARRYNLTPDSIIDFSASISPLGVPEKVMGAIQASLEIIEHYPDPECTDFCQIAAAYHGVPSQNILAGNGAAEIIYLIARMVKPRRALIPIPTFSEYAYAVESAGGSVVELLFRPHESGYLIDPGDFMKAIPGNDLVFICNPNNPTGTLWKHRDLVEIIKIGRDSRCLIVIDEAYLEMVENGSEYSVIGQAGGFHNLLVLKSLTKVYSLPGLRIGYAVGPSEMIKDLTQLRDPWSVNALAQIAGSIALQQTDYLYRLQELVRQERQYLFKEFGKVIGLKPVYPTANFMLVDTEATGISAGALREALSSRGILIRDCSSFRGMGRHHIRVAVRTRPDNERLVAAVRECLSYLSAGGE